MNSVLHITNGDTTTQLLNRLKIKGEIITWREMLCEGQTTTEVGSESFWRTRFEFLRSSYKVTKKTFIDNTLKEYRSLCNQKKQDEIVLWFEHDLFCQVNMLAVISWLKRFRKGRKVSLVQNGYVDTSKKLRNLSEFADNKVKKLYNNRIELSMDDIEYADYIWQLYCSDSPIRLETVHKFNPMSPFVYIEKAVRAHLLRFPSVENGLNKVENTILNTVKEQEPKSKEALVAMLLENQTRYGFSNLQYFTKINELKKLITSSFNPLKLSEIGGRVLHNYINYYGEIRSDFSYLGGAKKYSYLYVSANNKLLKISS